MKGSRRRSARTHTTPAAGAERGQSSARSWRPPGAAQPLSRPGRQGPGRVRSHADQRAWLAGKRKVESFQFGRVFLYTKPAKAPAGPSMYDCGEARCAGRQWTVRRAGRNDPRRSGRAARRRCRRILPARLGAHRAGPGAAVHRRTCARAARAGGGARAAGRAASGGGPPTTAGAADHARDPAARARFVAQLKA